MSCKVISLLGVGALEAASSTATLGGIPTSACSRAHAMIAHITML